MPNTLLSFIGLNLPPYSARGLTQSLEHIDGAVSLRRTINGELQDISDVKFRKYRSTISGDDQQPPAIDGVWPGLSVTVNCMVELAVLDNSTTDPIGPSDLGRPPVEWPARRDGDYIFYRPTLVMKVTGFNIDRDEWGAQVGWQLELEEV